MKLLPLVIVGVTLLGCATAPPVQPGPEYDLVIYGGTSAGVIAAVQAKQDGRSVVIVCPDTHLGGLSSSGLGWTDSGNKAVIGGLALGFYQSIYQHYANDDAWPLQSRDDFRAQPRAGRTINDTTGAMWVFEPHVAEGLFEQLIEDNGIPVYRDRWLDREQGVAMQGKRITRITMLSGESFSGRLFIDATYEGDLMAAAGVPFTVGRESNATYNETLNGNQPGRNKHQFIRDVSAYVVPGDPASGLLPRIGPDGAGEVGAGDDRVQAYNYRMCLTNLPGNRVPFPRPAGYDPAQYELLLRTLLAGSRHVFGKFDPMPNAKTDTNNHGPFSTDNIGMNHDYPEASYARRAEILDEHRTYQMGYFYFLCNDPRVPEDVRTRMSAWGLAKDEFIDSGHWPHQIYVREARRMVSDFVITERHLTRELDSPRPIGMGSYNMDSHNVRRYVDADGFVRNEGDVQVSPGGPYPIDYGAIVPPRGSCENLLVPVCVSSSHIAYGSVRMEPVFMVLGQSAAMAAGLALEHGTAVQDVAYDALRPRLLDAGQVLGYAGGTSAKRLPGTVIDDRGAALVGGWTPSAATGGYIDRGYHHDGDTRDGKRSATFAPDAPLPAGRYRVRVSYTAHDNRSSRTPVTVFDADGEHAYRINQRTPPAEDGFDTLGEFRYDGVTPPRVVIRNAETDGYVIADAVQWVKVNE